jgi:hypothetical protein
MNERGQELSTTTIILIILGVIILVVMIIGFSIGWNKIVPQLSSNNVQTVSTQCVTACSTNSIYDFCSRPFDLVSDQATIHNATCNFLAKKQGQYGISDCSSISCSNVVLLSNPTTNGQPQYTTKNFVAQANAAPCSSDPSYPGQNLQTLIGNTVYTITCPQPPASQ